ncbi:MAG: hypothetical protein P4M12_11020 [Gammaproteobacteria bacterium]|nr:hypothetical protein [Gammaproteobacteria bacterium]
MCPISLCVMDDPITVSSGIAYNRASLVQVFSEKGNPQTIKCAINPNHNIAIGELRNCTSVFIKNKIETFVKEQEKIAKDKIEGEIKRMEAAASSSSIPAEEPKQNSLNSARLRTNLFAPSVQSHRGNNDVAMDASSVPVSAANSMKANPMQQQINHR